MNWWNKFINLIKLGDWNSISLWSIWLISYNFVILFISFTLMWFVQEILKFSNIVPVPKVLSSIVLNDLYQLLTKSIEVSWNLKSFRVKKILTHIYCLFYSLALNTTIFQKLYDKLVFILNFVIEISYSILDFFLNRPLVVKIGINVYHIEQQHTLICPILSSIFTFDCVAELPNTLN